MARKPRGKVESFDLPYKSLEEQEAAEILSNRPRDATTLVSTLDPPAAALVGVIAILKEIEADDRKRVLDAACAYFADR